MMWLWYGGTPNGRRIPVGNGLTIFHFPNFSRSAERRREARAQVRHDHGSHGNSWPALELRSERSRTDPHKHRPDVDQACQIRQATTKCVDAAYGGVAPRPLRGVLGAVDRSQKNRENSIWLQPPLPRLIPRAPLLSPWVHGPFWARRPEQRPGEVPRT